MAMAKKDMGAVASVDAVKGHSMKHAKSCYANGGLVGGEKEPPKNVAPSMGRAMGGGVKVDDDEAEEKDGGGDPVVKAKAKQKSIGKIDGESVKDRMDRPKRASGGSVMAPGCASKPMATAAKPSSAAKPGKGPGY